MEQRHQVPDSVGTLGMADDKALLKSRLILAAQSVAVDDCGESNPDGVLVPEDAKGFGLPHLAFPANSEKSNDALRKKLEARKALSAAAAPPQGAKRKAPDTPDDDESYEDAQREKRRDKIFLGVGQHSSISKRHVELVYDFYKRRWALICLGRNGVFVDDIFVNQGDAPLPLRNKSKIQVPNAMPLVFSCPPPHGGGSEAVQRPSESLKVLIAQAMAQRADRSMMVGEIYQRIKDKHAFYRNQAEASWQSSIRHCLTINKCFVKTPKQHVDPAQKGACWTMVTDGDPALQQLLDEQRTTPAALLQQPSQTNPMFAAALAQVAAAAAGQQPGGGMGMQAPQILQGMAGLQGFQGFQGNAQLQQMLQIQQLQQLQQLQLAYGAQQGGEHAGFGQLQGAMRQAFDMARALAANAAATNSAATNVARTAVPDTMTLPVSGVGTYSDANDDENDDDEDAENGDSDDADADAGMVIDDE